MFVRAKVSQALTIAAAVREPLTVLATLCIIKVSVVHGRSQLIPPPSLDKSRGTSSSGVVLSNILSCGSFHYISVQVFFLLQVYIVN